MAETPLRSAEVEESPLSRAHAVTSGSPPPSSTPETAPLARDDEPTFADKVTVLARITPILLDVFSVVDDVFTEPDALSPEKRQVGLSRIYRAYKAAKAVLDPEDS